MDGVLLDSGAHHRQAWAALLDELGVSPAQPEYWRLTIGRPSVEAVPLLLGRATPWPEARRLAARKRDHYRRLARAGPPPVRGVVAFVDELAARRVPRAVATSASRDDADRLLGRTGLRDRFEDRKSTRLNSSHLVISYAVFCLKKKKDGHGTLRSVVHKHR